MKPTENPPTEKSPEQWYWEMKFGLMNDKLDRIGMHDPGKENSFLFNLFLAFCAVIFATVWIGGIAYCIAKALS